MNRSGRLTAVASSSALVALAVSALAFTGCPKPGPSGDKEAKGSTAAKADPWETAAKRLAKESDPAGARAALNKLAEELAARPDVPGAPALSPEAEKDLTALARLTPDDLNVVRPAGYTGGDAAYVAECMYLRDAARTIDPVGLPPAEQAKAAFNWVCRQVYIRPWVTDDGRFVNAVPPSYVLRRGWGTGLERATVALAVFQQLGLDAGLVGPPDAATKSIGSSPPWADAKELPAGPFWAVAVRAGADVLLFDPIAGRPFPAPLAQLKANPDLLKPWADAKDSTWKVPADAVNQATVYLTAPLPALAPRMATLEERVKADTGVHLAVDLKAVRDRLAAAPPAGPGVADVKVWNPPGEGPAYPRVLAWFLPTDDGGTDTRPPPQQFLQLYKNSRLPIRELIQGRDLLPPGIMYPGITDRLINGAGYGYEQAFVAPPSPLERIQRGQLQDAAKLLTDRQDGYGRAQEQVKNVTAELLEEWVKEANRVYGELRRAEYPDPNQVRPVSPTDPAVVSARAAVEEFWRVTAPVASALVARITARLGFAEASYLLALAKHEEAERKQLRADKATGADAARSKASAADAWAEAANTWRSFLDQAANLPGLEARTAHARTLAARANTLAPKPG
ncbi:MAG: hypothetical protein U0804_26160 [Gemmataceae bacterium]